MPLSASSKFSIYWDDYTVNCTSLSASGADSGYPISHLGPADVDRRTRWHDSSTGTVWVQFYNPTPWRPLGVGIFNHRIGWSGGNALHVKYGNTSPPLSTAGTFVVSGIGVSNPDIFLDFDVGAYKYWRIEVTACGANGWGAGRIYWPLQKRKYSSDGIMPVLGSGVADYEPTRKTRTKAGLQYIQSLGDKITRHEWIWPDGMAGADAEAIENLFDAVGASETFFISNPETSGRAFEVTLMGDELWRRFRVAANVGFALRMEEYR